MKNKIKKLSNKLVNTVKEKYIKTILRTIVVLLVTLSSLLIITKVFPTNNLQVFANEIDRQRKTYIVKNESIVSYYKISEINTEEFEKSIFDYESKVEEQRIKEEIEKKELEEKAVRLEAYLSRFGNKEYAKTAKNILEVSKKCGVDYRLITAISGVESGFGKSNMANYRKNVWGWMDGNIYKSFEDAENIIICRFSKGYVNSGLNTPEKVVNKYGPYNKPHWVSGVKFFMNQFDKYVEK